MVKKEEVATTNIWSKSKKILENVIKIEEFTTNRGQERGNYSNNVCIERNTYCKMWSRQSNYPAGQKTSTTVKIQMPTTSITGDHIE